MADIQAAHPAFFNIDYNTFYMDHCRDLEVVLSEIEESGRVVESLTPSLIPALAHRHDASQASDDDFVCLAMLGPDAKDD